MELKRKIIRRVNLAKSGRSLLDKPILFAYKIYKIFQGVVLKNYGSANFLKIKSIERQILGGKYNFVTVGQLVLWTEEWTESARLSGFDLIVAIPRSGLLVGSLIATKLGKPLTTPDLFPDSIWASKHMTEKRSYKNILLIDDSITSGKTMEDKYQMVKDKVPGAMVTKAALIASDDTKDKVDMFFKVVARPRVFEWNMLHSKKGVLAVDMDGVLCEEPDVGLDKNEPAYQRWMSMAKPYLIPSFEIDLIVSNRREKFRELTEKWLLDHSIKYKKLSLRGGESFSESKVAHKVKELMTLKPDMYWESSPSEAVQVWEATKIPTLCIQNKNLFS